MADVFISYKRADREWAERISGALRDAGVSCWWDTSLVAGEHFNQAIDRELKGCRCVVVIWSEAACDSRWVQAEALQGFERGILVATQIEDVALNYPFSAVKTIDLQKAGIEDVVADVQTKLGAKVVKARRRLFTLVSVSSVLCLAASMALSLYALFRGESDELIFGISILASVILGAFGAIALFEWISRRSSLVAVLGGGFAGAVAFGLMILVGISTEYTPLEYTAPYLVYTPAVTVLSGLIAFMTRRDF
jgi:hypothetical protein